MIRSFIDDGLFLRVDLDLWGCTATWELLDGSNDATLFDLWQSLNRVLEQLTLFLIHA